MFSLWLSSLRNRQSLVSRRGSAPLAVRRRPRPAVERLEDRVTPSNIYTVSNTNATGPGSLYQAITNANNPSLGSPSTIDFDIATSGAQIILQTTALPAITATTTIDATSEPGYSGTPLVILKGASSGQAGYDGLTIEASNCVIKGLAIRSFANGITIEGSGATGNVIESCYVGISNGGSTPQPNSGNGIQILGASNNTIGGSARADSNLISGNDGSGIVISNSGASGNLVENNIIGLTANGNSAAANGANGIAIENGATNNTIGGSPTVDWNYICGNNQNGVWIDGGGTSDNVVLGNYIGVDANNDIVANGNDGVKISDGATHNTIGGTDSGGCNLISGNGNSGIVIRDNGTSYNTVQDNIIGIGVNATGAKPNQNDGVDILNGASNNIVGGTTAQLGNWISGNDYEGIEISASSINTVIGNYVGTNGAGTRAVANGDNGILIENGSTGNTIGGTTQGSVNVLSGNDTCGVYIDGNGNSGNVIEGNLIGTDHTGLVSVANGQRGIKIDGANDNIIGGTTSAARNVISGNGGNGTYSGIYIGNPGADGNVVEGNYIGVGADGRTVLPNTAYGIHIGYVGDDNIIGGTVSGAGNIIEGNGRDGVRINDWTGEDDSTFTGHPGVGNEVLGNSIFDITEGYQGIYLGNNGNDSQAAPYLAFVSNVGGNTTVAGTLTGTPNTWYRLEFFSSVLANPSQGQTYLTFLNVLIPNGSDLVTFSEPLGYSVPAGQYVTATATNSSTLNTSEFSNTPVVDNTAPTTTDSLSGTSGKNGWYVSNVTVTLSATDSGSGVAATYYTVDGGSQQTYTGSAFTVSGDGSHHITFWSVDYVGNVEATHYDSFQIDTVKPHTTDSLTGTQGSNGWFTSPSVNVKLTAGDATSGVAATYYTVDGGSQQTYGSSAFTVSGDGTHHLTFWSVDNAGNVEATESDSIRIDSIKPHTTDTLTGTLGSNGWFTSPSVNETLTASDATSKVAATYYTVDGGSQLTYGGSAFSVSGEGSHHITFWSVDNAGNVEATESDSFKIDSVKPHTTDTLTGTKGSNGWYTSPSVNVTLTASDATSGVVATYYTVNGGSQQTYSGTPFTVSGEGSHHIMFWSVDVAGNMEATESDNVNIDTVKPHTTDNISGTQGTNGWYTSSSVSVTLNASDASSGIAATYYTVDGGSQQIYGNSPFTVSGEGSHQITFWSVDVAGNVENLESASLQMDSVKPHTTDTLTGTQGSNGWFTSSSVSVALTASDATSKVAATYYTVDGGSQQTYAGSAFTVIGEGSHHLTFWSVDNAGNVEATESDSVNIDTVKPHTTDSLSGTQGTNGWYTSGSISVTLNASDASSGIAATYYTVDGGSQRTYGSSAFSVSGEGTHQITFWSVDVAGNIENPESASFQIDSVKPHTTDTLTGTLGGDGWYTSPSVNVALTASDVTSGVAATYYTVDGGSQQTYSGGPFTVTGDGNHHISFWSVDVAGNAEAAQSDNVKIDTAKPSTTDTISGTQGMNGWYNSSSVSVTLNANDASSGIAATYYTVDGGSQQTYGMSAFTVSGEGTHEITFWSVDVAGNIENPESASFQIDSVKPHTTDTLTGTLGGDGWYTSPSVSVTLTAGDATSKVAATYYTVDGGSQQTYRGGAFAVAGDGTHQITFWSVDVAGNTEATQTDRVKIDTVAPTTGVSLVGVSGTDGWFTSSVSVTLTPSDAGSGVVSTHYSMDGGPSLPYTGTFTVSAEGSHTLQVVSVDAAGNTETGNVQTIHIDTTPPVLTLPPNQTFGATQLGGTLIQYAGATASDNLSAVNLTYQPPTNTLFPLGATTVHVTATDAAGNQTTGSFTVTVHAGQADQLAISNPSTVLVGGAFGVTVQAEDSFGNVDPTYTGSVALGLSGGPSSGKLSGITVLPIQNGVATFGNLSVNVAGSTYVLSAANTGDLISATAPLSVVAAPTFSVNLAPASLGAAAAGQPFRVTVTAMLKGTPDINYVGTVALTSTDPQTDLPSSVRFQPSDGGSRTITVTLNTPGKQTVSVADTSLASAKGTSNAVNVTGTVSPNANRFVLSGLPSSAVMGVSYPITITAVNAAGKTVPGYINPSVQITSNDSAFLPIVVDFTAGNKGVVKSSVVFGKLGSQTVTATDSAGITGSVPNVVVVSATTQLSTTLSASTTTAGNTITVTVVGETKARLPDSEFSDLLGVTTSDPNATIVAQPMSGGVQTYTITFTTSGAQTITVKDLARTAIAATTSKVTVLPGSASHLAVTGFPLFTITGASHSYSVAAEDNYGNVVTSGFLDTISVGGELYTFQKGDHGAHSFTTTLTTLGNGQSISVADTSNPSMPAIPETNISVVSGATTTAPDPLTPGATALIVIVPAGGANVVITPTNAAGTAVAVTVLVKGKMVSGGTFSSLGHIIVYGQTGNDVVTETTATIANQPAWVDIPAVLLGGSGTNTLSVAGSQANNLVVGGAGKDSLTGGLGQDILLGGGGTDTLTAGAGSDLLIGGSTVYDGNLAALMALMAEWGSGDSYLTRVQDLYGTSTGGANGNTLLNDATVLNDAAINSLVGGSGQDWYWVEAATDKLTGQTAGAVVTSK